MDTRPRFFFIQNLFTGPEELFRSRLRRIFFRECPLKIPRIAGYVRDFQRVLSEEKTSRMHKLFLNSSLL